MGVIRYPHTSPGVYTKAESIRLDSENTDLLYNSTTNIILNGGGTDKPFPIYYGYYPLKSKDGIYTEQVINTLKSKPFSSIISYNGVSKMVVTGDTFQLNEVTIPLSITEEELHNRILSGETYNSIADNENNCVVLILPRYIYKLKTFELTDDTFNEPIEDMFNSVKGEYMNGTMYDLLVMYNNHYTFSRICRDKVIKPIILEK